MRRRTRRLRTFVVVLASALLLPLGGYLYESHARSRDAVLFPPVGDLVDVGNRKLHVLCIGAGSPTVVFESSGFGNSVSSRVARTRLSDATRVCSYDRMGVGWSDPGAARISAGMLADDLRTLSDRVPIDSPFVLVASSIGGLTAELFAREYPTRVGGLVLLDAATSEMFPRVLPMIESSRIGMACPAISAAGRIGLLRLVDPFGLRSSPQSDPMSNAVMYRAQPWNTLCAMIHGLPETRQQFASAAALVRSIRVTALSAENTRNLAPPGFDQWAGPAKSALDQGLRTLSNRSTDGRWQIVPGSDHLIAESAPAAVIDAVLEMIQRDRAGRALAASVSRVH
jgi:pimeloyl-ACP methyl ester carboxylesterase